MKKKSGSRIVRLFKRIINVRTWADWDRMKSFTLYLVGGFMKLFVPQKTVDTESFEEAIARLNISQSDLMGKQKALYRLSLVMVVAAFLFFVYAGYQVFYGSFKATLVSLIVMLIALVLSFRYHFWYFQIKYRKLGCSFHEWFRQGLMGEKE